MLHLLLGRSKTGKSTSILQQIAQSGLKRPQILIVPEQYSHETERRLCTVVGNQSARYCEVLSFTRLANRVFTEAGGLADSFLDNGGRLLLMHEAVNQTASSLSVYQRSSRRAAFLQELLATSDELKSYCVPPVRLNEAGTERGGEAGGRLNDLSLILTAYDQLVSTRANDPRDRLTRMRERLMDSGYAKGKDFYVDCFTDFTPQERSVLSALLRDAHSVTIALTCGGIEPDGTVVFEAARRTALELLRMAGELHVGAEFQTLTQRVAPSPDCLSLAEQYLYHGETLPDTDEMSCEAIHLCSASSRYEEVEQAAGQIRTLLQSGQYRCRDILITARTMDGYDSLIETIFPRYDLPVFLGKREDILDKPILTLLTSALEVIDGYEYDDVFRYLRTGLTGLTPDEVDLLENYVVQWDIRGSKWSQAKPWSWNPAGYSAKWTEEDRAAVEHLDKLRRTVIAPLENLRKTKAASGSGLVRVLYAFLEEIQLPQRLESRAQTLTERGELRQAEEYRQLWDILVGAMEQCCRLMGDNEISLTEFADLFRLMLSQYQVSTIPVALDRIAVGDILRTAHREAKVVFVLGADDLHFPLVPQNTGLLTQEDRELLAEMGCALTPAPEQRMDREMTLAYDAVCLPTERLFLSWSQSGEESVHPAGFVQRLMTLFPHLTISPADPLLKCSAPIPALDWALSENRLDALEAMQSLPELGEHARQLQNAASTRRGALSRGAVDRLYGREVRISASKIDNIRSCHFGYFLQYGLKAKARKAVGFDAPQVGTFIHYVLEHLLKEAKDKGGVKALAQEQVKAMMEEIIKRYIAEELGGLEDQNPRFQFLFRRLLSTVELIVLNLTEELRVSDFQPMYFELGFGDGKELPPVRLESDGMTLLISGFVDRVDGWEKDGKLYLRVVDYKSGRKEFNLTEVWHGLQLQMLLYLFTLEDEGRKFFGKDQLIPAGVLYSQVHEVLLDSKDCPTPEKLQKKTDDALKRSGLLLDDPDVLEAMEHCPAGKSPRFLPITVRKNGTISGDALASAAQWGLLHRHIALVLRQIAEELAMGNINADPYAKPDHTACDWCDYREACHYEKNHGSDKPRYLYKMKGEAFWASAEAEQKKEVSQ